MAATARTPFFLTLVSNASTSIFPNNKPQSFKVELTAPISFDGTWEIALCEYYYPNNMFNVNEETDFMISLPKATIERYDKPSKSGRVIRSLQDNIEELPIIKEKNTTALCVGNPPSVTKSTITETTIVPEALTIPVKETEEIEVDSPEVTVDEIPTVQPNGVIENTQTDIPEDLLNHLQPVTSVSAKSASLLAFESMTDYSDDGEHIHFRYHTPKGKFSSISNLCTLLNRRIRAQLKSSQIFARVGRDEYIRNEPVNFEYDVIENRVNFKSMFYGTKLQYRSTAYLPFALGFAASKTSDITEIAVPHEGRDEPSLTQTYPAMFIYTNIIEYQMVGDSHAPLLRSVPIRNQASEDVVSELFIRPFYHELNRNYIKTIEIRICNDAGDEIIFQKGKTVLVLHFRPRALF